MNYIVFAMFAFVISIAALAVAWNSFRKAPRGQIKRLESVEEICADLDMRLASLHKSHRKLNARIAMQIARAEKREPAHDESETNDLDTEQKPSETSHEWKMRMRRAIAEGRLKHD